ncbi:MAG: hypothetical protein QOE13_710 [Gaiellaceae bacterium]|jgi:hypothetical protein|nr:hypothetical protein [Gaiellaceae bacterium]
MPSGGELRLRTLILALVALGGIWIALVVQRSGPAPAVAFASGPQPADFPTPELVRVPGLNRPVAATPIANESKRVRPFTRVPTRQTPDVKVRLAAAKPAAPAPAATVDVPQDDRSYAETPPPPLEPLLISDAQVVSVTSSSARLTWRTNVPAQAQSAYGFDAPTIWSAPSADSLVDHESVLTGLEFGTSYQVYLHAIDEWNRATTTTVAITTQAMPEHSVASTNGRQIVVDERAFFPTAVWGQCSDGFNSNIIDGINLFMGDGCSKDESTLPASLDGRAYSIVNAEQAGAAEGRGLIGWYYPDEWDAFLQSTVTRQDLDKSIPAPQAGRISFLTLTNHFYSLATPLPQGKGMYPTLMSIPDVVGFDLYPLQVWCRPAYGDVMDAQRELGTSSGGKPTFQWIEVAPMEHKCAEDKHLDPTPATVRAESWLAIAGGAAALGYFPNHWPADIGSEIARTNREIKALSQALLAPVGTATSEAAAVRVSTRTLNGATYVIAVNTSNAALETKIAVEGIAGRSPVVVGGGQVIGADDTGFADNFGPLAARVYIIPPAGW